MKAHSKETFDTYIAPSREINHFVTHCVTEEDLEDWTKYIRTYSDSFAGTSSGEYSNRISSITMESSIPKGKFFGYVITKKLTIEIAEIVPEEYMFKKGDVLKVNIRTGTENTWVDDFPYFYVESVETDLVNKKTTVVAYDRVYHLRDTSIASVGAVAPEGQYLLDYIIGLCETLGFTVDTSNISTKIFTGTDGNPFPANRQNLWITPELVNYNPDSVTLFQVLEWAAETVGIIIKGDELGTGLRFQYLDVIPCDEEVGASTGEKTHPWATINPNSYFNFKSSGVKTLTGIRLTTPLGDNLLTGTELIEDNGFVQTIADNPFLTLRDDRAEVLDNLLYEIEHVGGATAPLVMTEYTLESRGNLCFEEGDCVKVYEVDETYKNIHLLNEKIVYDGGLRYTASFDIDKQEDVHYNSTNLGQTLKNTQAKVDKVNNEITLVASKADANAEAISAINMNVDSISASVSKVEQSTNDAINGLNDDINTLTNKVEAVITPEEVELQIQSAMSNGIDSVTTSTGFTFNQDGLTVSKTGSEMTTNIDEDGMSVYRNDTEVLTADNEGVIAYNLKAKTYLIIGEYSRFEDYTNTSGEARTGCFWIGG